MISEDSVFSTFCVCLFVFSSIQFLSFPCPFHCLSCLLFHRCRLVFSFTIAHLVFPFTNALIGFPFYYCSHRLSFSLLPSLFLFQRCLLVFSFTIALVVFLSLLPSLTSLPLLPSLSSLSPFHSCLLFRYCPHRLHFFLFLTCLRFRYCPP